MNLSSLFKNKQTLLLRATLLGIIVFGLLSANYILSSVVFIICIISWFVPTESNTSKSSKLQEQMYKVLCATAQGKFENRVTNIPDDDSTEASFAWAINDTLDQLEAFMRDTSRTITNASEGKAYRRTYAAGLHGLFSSTAKDLNNAISAINSGYKTKIRGEMAHNFSLLGGGIS